VSLVSAREAVTASNADFGGYPRYGSARDRSSWGFSGGRFLDRAPRSGKKLSNAQVTKVPLNDTKALTDYLRACVRRGPQHYAIFLLPRMSSRPAETFRSRNARIQKPTPRNRKRLSPRKLSYPYGRVEKHRRPHMRIHADKSRSESAENPTAQAMISNGGFVYLPWRRRM
jgi:hypothetical protein